MLTRLSPYNPFNCAYHTRERRIGTTRFEDQYFDGDAVCHAEARDNQVEIYKTNGNPGLKSKFDSGYKIPICSRTTNKDFMGRKAKHPRGRWPIGNVEVRDPMSYRNHVVWINQSRRIEKTYYIDAATTAKLIGLAGGLFAAYKTAKAYSLI